MKGVHEELSHDKWQGTQNCGRASSLIVHSRGIWLSEAHGHMDTTATLIIETYRGVSCGGKTRTSLRLLCLQQCLTQVVQYLATVHCFTLLSTKVLNLCAQLMKTREVVNMYRCFIRSIEAPVIEGNLSEQAGLSLHLFVRVTR
jgi:hypothetical protein